MTRLHRPGGFSMAKLPGLVRTKMLTDGLPAVTIRAHVKLA